MSGTCGPIKPAADEKRPVLVRFDHLDRFIGHLAVGLFFVGSLGLHPVNDAPMFLFQEVKLITSFSSSLSRPLRIDHLVPGRRVIPSAGADLVRHAVMKHLADPAGKVAVVFEKLGQGDDVREMCLRMRTPLPKIFVVSGRIPLRSDDRLGLQRGNWQ